MDFIIHHHKQHQDTQFMSLAKLIGTAFTVGEIRGWEEGENKADSVKVYKNTENIVIPLSFILNANLRDNLKKMVSDKLQTQDGYVPSKDEKIIPLGKVSTEDYQYFLKHGMLPAATLRQFTEEG